MIIKNIAQLLLFIAFVTLMFLLNYSSDKCLDNKNYQKKLFFEGVIVMKYQDRKYHSGSEMFELNNGYKYAWEEDVYLLEDRNLYTILNEQDSVYKKKIT